jgi:DNA helicase-2/ATP-dependent DNA helicase PcrA
MNFNPSPYQRAIFDWIKNGKGSAIVNAVAGAGKTTTIVKALELIPATQRVTFLAFNKKIATELQARVPQHVKAATFHSQGFNAWRAIKENVQSPDGNKVRALMRQNLSQVEASAFGTPAVNLVSKAKSMGVGVLLPDEAKTWFDIASHFDIELPESEGARQRTIQAAQMLLRASVELADAERSVIDFDDMLYMPLLRNTPLRKVDWLFVDEAQDTNGVQLALLGRMLAKDGRLVAVGDPHQAIYGFRGADAMAMENIRAKFSCRELPLTISYRCAQTVVRLAQTLVPSIEASPSATQGEVLETTLEQAQFRNTDVVICRNTAPIVELAYNLIGKGVGCKVLGREIGQALSTLVDKMKSHNLEELSERLGKFLDREQAKFQALGQEDRAEAVQDKVDCIRAIANFLPETQRTIHDLKAAIEHMFSDSGEGLLTLCTAHKSKGFEWERVFIYEANLMPSKWAKQQWQQIQEKNLMYVAWTRAKKTLVFITDGKHGGSAPAIPETMRERAMRRATEACRPINEFWIES